MSDLSSAETALLGLLCGGEMHAYQLEKTVAYRSMRDWTDLSMSSIYKVMRKLEKTGLAASRSDITKSNKIRRTYQVTAAGRKAIRTQLLKWLEEPEIMKYRLDLATYNFNLTPKAQALKALKTYQQGLKKSIEGYQQLEEFMAKEGCPSYRLALARRPCYLLAAEMDWVDAFAKEMEKGASGGKK